MKDRVEVVWFVDGNPRSRGFRSNDPVVRALDFADKIVDSGKYDKDNDVTVYHTSLDGEDTYGYYERLGLSTIVYHELG